jgi:hypothetical protein
MLRLPDLAERGAEFWKADFVNEACIFVMFERKIPIGAKGVNEY